MKLAKNIYELIGFSSGLYKDCFNIEIQSLRRVASSFPVSPIYNNINISIEEEIKSNLSFYILVQKSLTKFYNEIR
jgi:hypothetical protein